MHKTFCCSFCLLINNTTFYSTELLLWSPYGIGQTIIFALWFLLLLLSFFPRLISAVADWMSAILPQSTHGVALVRISDAGLKRAARGSLEMQDPKMSPKAPSIGTIAQLCRAISSQLRHVSTIGKTC